MSESENRGFFLKIVPVLSTLYLGRIWGGEWDWNCLNHSRFIYFITKK